jgi:hypothetical protein
MQTVLYPESGSMHNKVSNDMLSFISGHFFEQSKLLNVVVVMYLSVSLIGSETTFQVNEQLAHPFRA